MAGHLIDMDHAATTALRPVARAAMEPFLAPCDDPSAVYGNPSGSHVIARAAVRALDEAREQVADSLGCLPDEVVFTSGGTEADNHAITGGMPARRGIPVCSAVEHPAVLSVTRALGGSTVGVDQAGRIDLDALGERLVDLAGQVSVVSVMTANNELGTVNDIGAVATLVREVAPGVPLHTDAVQAAPWLDLSLCAPDVDLVSVSAHKLGGPRGVGALVGRRGTVLAPLLHGGGQEHDRRGGSHDVAGIVGFAAALREVVAQRGATNDRVTALRDRLRDRATSLEGVVSTVDPGEVEVLPGHCHLLVEGVSGEELLLLLESHDVCASAASSCASGAIGSSHVVTAIGHDDPGHAPLRLTLGTDSTNRDVEATVAALALSLDRIRDRP
ncbi:MAG: cysteine desulfurase family protein [Microthrixaceae bacterium]